MLHKVADNRPSPFDFLPPEVTEEIVGRLDPKTPIALVSKSMCAVFINVNQWYWRACFIRHFPHLYGEIKNKKNVDWRAEFLAAEKIEYKDLSEKMRNAFSFVKEGLIDKLQDLALPYYNIYIFDGCGVSIIDWAARSQNRGMHDYFYSFVEEFFLSIDVRMRDSWGLTLLHHAVIFDRSTDFITMLIENEFDVNAQTGLGATPLFVAAVYKRMDQIETLLANGADVDLVDTTGQSPLFAAVVRGHYAVVVQLINRGADVTLADNAGTTPLYVAALEGDMHILLVLLQHGADVNARDNDNETPIYAAAQNGHLQVVMTLHQRGAELNAALNDGYTPLMAAAQEGKLDVVNYLLSNGANVNSAAANGGTPLFLAAQKGFIDVVTELLAHDAIDLDIPFLSNAASLIEFGENHPEDVQMRLDAFIEEQEDPDDIRMSAEDIARIMGNEEITGLIQQKREQLQQRQQPVLGG